MIEITRHDDTALKTQTNDQVTKTPLVGALGIDPFSDENQLVGNRPVVYQALERQNKLVMVLVPPQSRRIQYERRCDAQSGKGPVVFLRRIACGKESGIDAVVDYMDFVWRYAGEPADIHFDISRR
jgi:hypothetical protein